VASSSLPARIVLIGPSGSGKSELAIRLANQLGYEAVDTDAAIEARIGMPVFEFFARFGEAAFRAIETRVLQEACSRSTPAVIATGGGVVTIPLNWSIMRPGSLIVALRAEPESLVARINSQTAGGDASAVRPLLAGDPIERIREQLGVRQRLYDLADITVDTDDLGPAAVANEVMRIIQERTPEQHAPVYTLPGMVERSDIYVGQGCSTQAATLARRRWPRSRRVWIVTDDNIGPLWAANVANQFESADFEVHIVTVPQGESSKSFIQVEAVCDAITSAGSNRQDLVVALGGGVVGDLAGLVASICLRGLTLIQMPTSLLAMVDSSVGGKTGINTTAGKNLVGTFNQPALVFVDSEFLSTLPFEEYRSGMAEVIKHSVIQPATPLGGNSLQSSLTGQSSLDPVPEHAIDEVLRLNVGIKHSVVQADERESGLRMVLNFGHTTGHAIEADGYRYRHGEAVGLGMLVAARMALELERVDRRWVDYLEATLRRAGLPVRLEARVDEVIGRLVHDKKNIDGTLQWVMPHQVQGVEIVNGIDPGVVRRALTDIGAS
jgi:shikimate kinase / 3-dehydroquinate synthase